MDGSFRRYSHLPELATRQIKMESSKEETSLKVSGKYPLRGALTLNSSPNLTNFAISLGYVLSGKQELRGRFSSKKISDFVQSLTSLGYAISESPDAVYIDSDHKGNEAFNGELVNLEDYYQFVLTLSSKGYAEISNNTELVDFVNYLGFVTEKKSEKKVGVFNKVSNSRDTIVFQDFNQRYLLLAILLQFLNLSTFSIVIPEDNVQVNLLTDLLHQLGVISDLDHSKNVHINFSTDKLSVDNIRSVHIPGDPIEFGFFASLALYTQGEIEISGLNPRFLTSLLRLYSSVGGEYDTKDSDIVRIWFSGESEVLYDLSESIDIDDNGYMTMLIPGLSSAYSSTFSIPHSQCYSRAYLQDINRLGGKINIDGEKMVVESQKNFKDQPLYLEGDIFQDFSRMVLALISEGTFEIFDYYKLTDHSSNLVEKLQQLGARIS